MAEYADGTTRVVADALAQTNCPTATAWTTFYTVGGGANNNGLNTPAVRGARNVIVDIVNRDASAQLLHIAHVPVAETTEPASVIFRAYVPANGMTSTFILGMKLGGLLRYYVESADKFSLTVHGEELQ